MYILKMHIQYNNTSEKMVYKEIILLERKESAVAVLFCFDYNGCRKY